MAAALLEAYQVGGDSVNPVFTTGQATVSLPQNDGGTAAKFVLLTTTEDVHFLVGVSGQISAAVSNAALLMAGNSVVVNVVGCDLLSHIGNSTGGTLGITPLANQ